MTDYGERRRSQRVKAKLSLQVYLGDGPDTGQEPARMETVNISTTGVYFMTDRFLAPMTKLALGIEVAVPGADEGETDLALVRCEGLVVRTEPEAPVEGDQTYEVAVFFTWIEPEGQTILEEHIELLLAGA
jgi:c-di-GMP-binding flagellar brake protein YcgR